MHSTAVLVQVLPCQRALGNHLMFLIVTPCLALSRILHPRITAEARQQAAQQIKQASKKI